MSLPAPVSISNQANQIRAVLLALVTAGNASGQAVVASNMKDLWEQAADSSDMPRCLICYNGEQSRGDFSIANRLHRVDRQWIVVVTRGRGYSSNRGDSLTQSVVNAPPFYDLVESVRDTTRTMLGISEEFPVDYKSIEPASYGNLVVDAYLIRFSTANDICAIQLTQPNPPV